MGRHDLSRRVYGARYYETRTITDRALLAERILADLPPAGTGYLPSDAEFSIHVLAGVLLQVQVGGLVDDFTFLDRITRRYSRAANELIAWLGQFMESYNWVNPADATDRRFAVSVYLLAESEYHSMFWTPGVVRIF
jgi:hypothetical protein